MNIKIIALNTLKEAVRDKIFYNPLIFALLVIAASVLIGDLSIGAGEKITKDIGLAAILLFGILTAIFVGVGLVSKEVERRTLYTILTKPVHRYEFLLGKYLGSVDISISKRRETQLLSDSQPKTKPAFPNCSNACRD